MEKSIIAKTVAESGMFRGVPENEVYTLLEKFGARCAEYSKGEIILRNGVRVHEFGLFAVGAASIVHEDFWGNRTLISKLGEGQLFAEAFALSGGTQTYVTVTADRECTVVWLDADKVTDIGGSPTEAHARMLANLLSDFASKALTVNEKMRHMSKRTTKQKLLSYLSARAAENSSSEFDIPLGRTQLADYLAVDRSAMTTELSKLKKEGAVEFSGRHFRLLHADAE